MPSIKYVGSRNSISLDDVCFLLKTAYTFDEYKQQIETKTPEMVYCSPLSVSQKEFMAAAQNNLRAERVLVIQHDEYDGEGEVEYNRIKYSIYRTHARDDGYIELYCEESYNGNTY